MEKTKKYLFGIFSIIIVLATVIFAFYDNSIYVYDEKMIAHKIDSHDAPLAVFVWSAGCGACVYSLQHISFLKEYFENMGGKFMLVLVDEHQTLRDRARAHFIRFNVSHLKTFFDHNMQLQKRYDIKGWPVLLLFKQGKLVERIEGFVAWGQRDRMQSIDVLFE